MKKTIKRSECPISSALDIFGDKWSLLIIRDIALTGKNTYNEFLSSEEGIATNVLADRLAKLESSGILVKKMHPLSKAKIFYSLSQKGIDLLPVLVEMTLWSSKYLQISSQASEFAKLLKQDKEAMISQLSTGLKKKMRSV